jgi:hypothetical protein
LLFRDNTRHLRDILEAIDLIQLFLRDMTFESYQTDLKTKSAVERQMQIMTEAAIRFGGDAERIAPGPDWEGFRGWGTSSGMLITELTTKLSGIPFRMSFRSCVKLSWMHSGRTAPMSRIAGECFLRSSPRMTALMLFPIPVVTPTMLWWRSVCP